MMYPEVYFIIVLKGQNIQKRELFISVVRSPLGKCYMSNVSVIPSDDTNKFEFMSFLSTHLLMFVIELHLFR